MKTINQSLAALMLFIMASCSSAYYQIGTITSPDFKIQNNGDFKYDNEDITIAYDFWSTSGTMTFAVTNNSSNDIMLDLTHSFFIENGYAFDYPTRSLDTFASGTIDSKEAFLSSTKMGNKADKAMKIASSMTKGNSVIKPATDINSSLKSESIETAKVSVVTIPAHSTKVFGGYSIAYGEYKKCGLVRDPRKKENAVLNFTMEESPMVVENRLVFLLGDDMIPVVNTFYVSELQNLPEDQVIMQEKALKCNGTEMNNTYNVVNLFQASNRYYVKYLLSGYDDNGRKR